MGFFDKAKETVSNILNGDTITDKAYQTMKSKLDYGNMKFNADIAAQKAMVKQMVTKVISSLQKEMVKVANKEGKERFKKGDIGLINSVGKEKAEYLKTTPVKDLNFFEKKAAKKTGREDLNPEKMFDNARPKFGDPEVKKHDFKLIDPTRGIEEQKDAVKAFEKEYKNFEKAEARQEKAEKIGNIKDKIVDSANKVKEEGVEAIQQAAQNKDFQFTR